MLEGAFVVQDETLSQFSHLYRGVELGGNRASRLVTDWQILLE